MNLSHVDHLENQMNQEGDNKIYNLDYKKDFLHFFLIAHSFILISLESFKYWFKYCEKLSPRLAQFKQTNIKIESHCDIS